MIDFSFIGKEGIIVQYEDIISLIGFNVVRYLKSKNINEEINRMSDEDILLEYFNRKEEDISNWILNKFGIEFNITEYLDSNIAFRPNLLYSYRIFDTAYKNGIKNLVIHSEYESKAVKTFINNTFQIPVKYTHGDIIPVLKNSKNYTYLTSSTKNITKCLDIHTPIALTIVDEYMYLADIIINKIDDKLRERNVYVCYTGILSAGFI